MEPEEHAAADRELRIYELIQQTIDRRNEVVELVYAYKTPEDAEERVRNLFGVAESHISRAVLDMQVYRWTRSEREEPDARADGLRRLLAP